VSPADEAARSEGVAPEPELGPDGTWSEADTAAVGAAVSGADAEGGEVAVPLDPLSAMERERDEYLLALQRTQADFENYRKRVTRLQEEQAARASSDLVSKLLPVLDTLDLALAHQSGPNAESDDAKALTASRSMLLNALSKEGLERVDEAGVPFDPAVHDAVSRTEHGSEDGTAGEVVIDQVLRSGYRWRGQVVRPAMVSVRG
jgi:molecular chaperone GrpE